MVKRKRFGLKEWWVVLVVGILIGVTIGVVGSQLLSIAAPNTATQDVPCGTYNSFLGTLSTTTGGGQYPQQPGENQVGAGIAANPGEIYQKTNFYYSWTDTGYSEPIVAAGQTYGCGLVAGTATAERYAFFISNDGGATWDTFKNSLLGGADGNELTYSPPGGGTIGLGTYTCFPSQSQQWCINSGANPWTTSQFPNLPFTIHGFTYVGKDGKEHPIVDGAWLKVTLQVQSNQWFDMASDIAQLHSALPQVNFVSQRTDAQGNPLYQVGDTAVVNYNVPVTLIGNGTAYYLTILNLNTNQAIGPYSEMPITQANGQIKFPVTSDLYVPSVGNTSFAPDRLRATIDSQIFHAQMQDVAVVDNASKSPSMGPVKWNQAFYHEGDTVTINFTASPNLITQSPIAKFYVLAHIGGLKEYDNFVSATTAADGSGSGTVTFTATNAGPLTVEVTAYDALGRQSGIARDTEVVGPAINMCVQFPNLVECTGGGGPFHVPSILQWLAIIFLAVGVIMLLVGFYVSKNPLVKGLLIIVGIVLTVIGVALVLLIVFQWVYFAINHTLFWNWG